MMQSAFIDIGMKNKMENGRKRLIASTPSGSYEIIVEDKKGCNASNA